MTNQFPGLFTGPLDHRATSIINAISNTAIDMGATVLLDQNSLPIGELLPRVRGVDLDEGSSLAYGVAVGGDADGIYGFQTTPDTGEFAATEAGQAVQIVTQGRCPARVIGNSSVGVPAQINIGDPLTHINSRLHLAESGDFVIARALDTVGPAISAIIAVDVKREGSL